MLRNFGHGTMFDSISYPCTVKFGAVTIGPRGPIAPCTELLRMIATAYMGVSAPRSFRRASHRRPDNLSEAVLTSQSVQLNSILRHVNCLISAAKQGIHKRSCLNISSQLSQTSTQAYCAIPILSAMSAPHILIVGAGIGGLTLAQALRKQNITFEIFDRDEGEHSRRQGWAIGIHSYVATPANIPWGASLTSDVQRFRRSTRLGSGINAATRINEPSSSTVSATPIRVLHARLDRSHWCAAR